MQAADCSGKVPYVASFKDASAFALHVKHTDFVELITLICVHEKDLVFLLHRAIEHTYVYYHATIGIEDRVVNQRAQRCLWIALRWWDLGNNCFEDFIDPDACLRRC